MLKIEGKDIIRAENGDKEAIQKMLSYFSDCVDSEISPDHAVMSYLSKIFQSYLNGNSLEKAFSLIGEEGRPEGEHFERNALLVVGVAYEKRQGLRDIDAFENVAERHNVSASVVKRAWQTKSGENYETILRDLIEDTDIVEYKKLCNIEKASS